tara:strand:+ start:31547 stop:32350 length:804 start_codon:yes stop_codon:yes gene_type:complete
VVLIRVKIVSIKIITLNFVSGQNFLHTSTRIFQSDFTYRRVSGVDNLPFEEVFPDYHPQDRVGLVSPRLENGLLGASVALLALTTGFYDNLRTKSKKFFDYPQHFMFVGGTGTSVFTEQSDFFPSVEECAKVWGWLDIWPETNWHVIQATPFRMLEAIYRQQINRIIWPSSFLLENVETQMPFYANDLLHSRLKSVWYYDSSQADIEICGSEVVMDVIRESLDVLPGKNYAEKPKKEAILEKCIINKFKTVKPDVFLKDMAVCFTDG